MISVVVPVRNGTATLGRSLSAIVASDTPRGDFEIIVVDDASSDASATIAARYADTVVRLPGRGSGPAYARNRGAELARGDIIAFLDADVMIRRDTLALTLKIFGEYPGLDAISATHDAQPAAPNFLSQYWNLLLHFGEKEHGGLGANFASGYGVIRRSTLVSAGMYDEWRFKTACVEGLELGQRLERAGHDVLLSPDLQVTHLRHWDLRAVSREVWNRSVLLSRSLGYSRTRASVPSEVVFTLSRATIPALAVVAIVALSAAFLPDPQWPVKGALAFAAILLTNFPLLRFYARERGPGFAALAAPVHLLFQSVGAAGLCVGWLMRDAVGDPLPDATTQAYAEVGLETWPPVPRQR